MSKKTTNGNEQTSALLARILAELPEDNVSIETLMAPFQRRSFGGVLLLLAAVSLIPGVSIFSGLAMAVIGLQMLAGYTTPAFPVFIRRYQIDSAMVHRIGEKCLGQIIKIEAYIKPRALQLTQPPALNVLGAIVFTLCLVIMLPLPFSNLPPAIAIIIMAMGLLERDGLFIIISLVAALLALAIGYVIASVAIESLLLFFNQVSH
ncbi:exopolysaccharide biosynthesis protein [Dasania sp. GY-MA-18]|uniref:Exopolysaccharide biosynthesis protein n=1 Tax=Dasania phycosphaerae TaxID=2950436 RepID=A0A9J6RJJ2_9GAMM|nr:MULTISPECIES: exopolysaccharide biosynthesis protein [Dasania]MCR8922215.1 exopolysaccharide biosynthesis protein [Dasania sp. GY-MA-18]MCZ0864643.1 exopolysaccharide biosynthesis protein [Dasania phycosphaerae]MCZ0868371.1 exopolysaccharide biosynthesis protein [Dasania phycosphaerae]